MKKLVKRMVGAKRVVTSASWAYVANDNDSLASYWAGSATASYIRAHAEGRVTTVVA